MSACNGPSGAGEGVACADCGLLFTTTPAFDLHRPDGQCLLPYEVGLVVAPRIALTWSLPWVRDWRDVRQAEDD